MDTPIVDAPITINERKEKIYKLGQERKREGDRIVHAREKALSEKYYGIDTAFNEAKDEYEKIVGRPYSPPNPKPSQVDSTLFIRPRTRTSSAESQHQEEETASATLS